MRLLSPIIIWITMASSIYTQCDNYGIQSGTTCTCPPGVGGSDCSLPACGGTLYDGPKRPTIKPTTEHYGNLSSCTCPDGWNGVACNVCYSPSACTSAYTTNHPANAGGDTGAITCSKSLRVYTVGQMSCPLQNPTLQALFPGKATMNILRNVNPANALAANVSYGAAGTTNVQLWYDGEEQFFCNADTCTQDVTDGSDWSCHDLKCHCRENATFCGATPATSITSLINDLSGDLRIKCSNQNDGSVQCASLQATITSVFGGNGLVGEACQFGECVAQSVIDVASGINPTGSTSGSVLPRVRKTWVASFSVAFTIVCLVFP